MLIGSRFGGHDCIFLGSILAVQLATGNTRTTSAVDERHLRYAGPGACFTPAWLAHKLCIGESNRPQCSSLGPGV